MKKEYTIDELERRLKAFSGCHSESKDLVQWAGSGYLFFLEESDDDSEDSKFLYEILGDIEAQWEMLMANTFDKEGQEGISKLALPRRYVNRWLDQIDKHKKMCEKGDVD